MDYARLNNYKSLYQMKIQEIKKTTVHVEELLYLYIHTRRVKYQTRLQSRTSDNIWITADEEFKISLHRDWELTREKFRGLKVFFIYLILLLNGSPHKFTESSIKIQKTRPMKNWWHPVCCNSFKSSSDAKLCINQVV